MRKVKRTAVKPQPVQKTAEEIKKQVEEPKVWHLRESEIELPDDYPIITEYVYIADTVVTRSKVDTTAGEWKRRNGVKSLRRCDLFAPERENNFKVGDLIR